MIIDTHHHSLNHKTNVPKNNKIKKEHLTLWHTRWRINCPSTTIDEPTKQEPKDIEAVHMSHFHLPKKAMRFCQKLAQLIPLFHNY